MNRRTLIILMAVLFVMVALLPFAVPDGAVTTEAHERYMNAILTGEDDEYAFLWE